MLDIGTQAPDLPIVTHSGYKGPLSHFWQNGHLILYFYPKDETPICTKQVCHFQDELSEFARFGATVVGSSTGSVTSHHQFAEKYGLEYPLIADVGGRLARAYRAFRNLFRVSKRISYVIDEGKIVGRCHSELTLSSHFDMIRQFVR